MDPHRELTELDVSALLAAAMIESSQQTVAAKTKTRLERLLDMIEGKQDFNRRVLRFLGIQRQIRYILKETQE